MSGFDGETLIVKMAVSSDTEVERQVKSHGWGVLNRLEKLGFAVVKGPRSEKSRVRRILEQIEGVEYVEEDQIIKLSPIEAPKAQAPKSRTKKGKTTQPAQVVPWGVKRVNGGQDYTGPNVAWVIDTGVDFRHKDLNVDTSRGYNAFTSGRDARNLDDNNGHGTHVAGTIAAKNNDIGVVGVAAGATVVPVKVLNGDGAGSYSGVIAGINHVAQHGKPGDVANLSLGGPASRAVDDAVVSASQRGINFVLAAGNENQYAGNVSPARVNGPNIYTVSAFSQGDYRASFSNYGNPPVDYGAPGVNIHSTWRGGSYNTISGTSMAAPHVAGLLLLGNGQVGGYVNGDVDGVADPILVHSI